MKETWFAMVTDMEQAGLAFETNLPKEIVKRVARYFREVLLVLLLGINLTDQTTQTFEANSHPSLWQKVVSEGGKAKHPLLYTTTHLWSPPDDPGTNPASHLWPCTWHSSSPWCSSFWCVFHSWSFVWSHTERVCVEVEQGNIAKVKAMINNGGE